YPSGPFTGNRAPRRARTAEGLCAYECACFTDVGGGVLCRPTEARRAQALPARADARAAVPVQPGLRGLREDPVSSADLAEASDRRAVSGRGRRVRRAGRVDPGRRAAHVPGYRAPGR